MHPFYRMGAIPLSVRSERILNLNLEKQGYLEDKMDNKVLINDVWYDGAISAIPVEQYRKNGKLHWKYTYEARVIANHKVLTKRFERYDDCLDFLVRKNNEKQTKKSSA